MNCALDQLGFLQFEQLVAALFDVAAGIAVETWSEEPHISDCAGAAVGAADTLISSVA